MTSTLPIGTLISVDISRLLLYYVTIYGRVKQTMKVNSFFDSQFVFDLVTIYHLIYGFMPFVIFFPRFIYDHPLWCCMLDHIMFHYCTDILTWSR